MRSRIPVAGVLLGLVACAALERPPAAPFSREAPERRLTLLHVSDTESDVVASAAGEAGLGRFVALARTLEARSEAPTIFLGAGDGFMPAPALQLELDGVNAVGLANDAIGLHASALGNHELDLGETFLAEMIGRASFPYLTSTVDFLSGPMAPLVVGVPTDGPTPWLEHHPGRVLPRGRICAGGALEGEGSRAKCGGLAVGVVGATTETLASIASTALSSSRSVASFEAVVERIQEQVDALTREGIDIIVLVSHLQDVRRELALVEAGLRGVDVIVAGGGEDRLASPGHRLLPSDGPSAVCAGESPCYPIVRRARDGAPVLIVATGGQHRYLGQLGLAFDRKGWLTGYDRESRPWPVDDRSLREVGASVGGEAAALEARIRGALEPLLRKVVDATVFLDGERENVRNRQTNLGDLSADSLAWAARAAEPPGGRPIVFALRNGGGIRSSIGSGGEDGAIRMLDIEAALRFDNPIVTVESSHRELKDALEAAFRGVGTARGHFPQVSAEVLLEFDPEGVEQEQALVPGPEAIVTAGGRVWTLVISQRGAAAPLEIVREGRVLTPDARIRFALPDYLARGGDGYFPSAAHSLEAEPVVLGGEPVTEQGALRAFLLHLVEADVWDGGRAYADPVPGRAGSFTRIRPRSSVDPSP